MAIQTPNTLKVGPNKLEDGQAAGAISAADIREVVDSLAGMPSSTKTTSYTLALADAGTMVEMNASSPLTLTVPTNASVAFDVGTVIRAMQLGTSQFTVTPAVGVTLRSALSAYTSRAQYSVVSMRKRATNEWVLWDDLTTGTSSVPLPASTVGFNTLTYGPNVILNSNWRKFDPATSATQSGNGVVLGGGGNNYNAHITTAVDLGGGVFAGTAFGGGGYFEATLSWANSYSQNNGWPAWWAGDMTILLSGSQWPGQAAGYSNWIEPDFMEYLGPDDTEFGGAIHNWYNTVGSNIKVSTSFSGYVHGANVHQPHKYGFLWVPATASSQGYAKWYFDRVQIPGWTPVWNLYNGANSPPPVIGTTAFSIMDNHKFQLLLGTSIDNPMTVTSVEVWQASAAGNISA